MRVRILSSAQHRLAEIVTLRNGAKVVPARLRRRSPLSVYPRWPGAEAELRPDLGLVRSWI